MKKKRISTFSLSIFSLSVIIRQAPISLSHSLPIWRPKKNEPSWLSLFFNIRDRGYLSLHSYGHLSTEMLLHASRLPIKTSSLRHWTNHRHLRSLPDRSARPSERRTLYIEHTPLPYQTSMASQRFTSQSQLTHGSGEEDVPWQGQRSVGPSNGLQIP